MPTPEFYVVQERVLNAYAIGFHQPGTVVLHSSMLNCMTRDELLFIIGHELTHIKCGHCKYLVFTNASIGSSINQIAAFMVDLIFKFWSRKTELTCDRGGVIACKNPRSAMTALAKLVNPDETAARSAVETAVRGSGAANNLLATHPEIENRIIAIWQYSQTRDFNHLSTVMT